MRLIASVLLLAALPLAGQVIEDEAEVRVHAYGGTAVSMAGQADTGITPFALLFVNAPLGETELSKLPSIQVMAALTKLPGEAEVTSSDKLDQFKALEFSVGAQEPLTKSHRLNIGAEFGFATRLPGDVNPRDQTARWANVFVKIRAEEGFLSVGYGLDQRLTGTYRPAILITGAVKLATIKQISQKAKMMAVMDAILGADAPTYVRIGGKVVVSGSLKTRDVVRVGIVVGL